MLNSWVNKLAICLCFWNQNSNIYYTYVLSCVLHMYHLKKLSSRHGLGLPLSAGVMFFNFIFWLVSSLTVLLFYTFPGSFCVLQNAECVGLANKPTLLVTQSTTEIKTKQPKKNKKKKQVGYLMQYLGENTTASSSYCLIGQTPLCILCFT